MEEGLFYNGFEPLLRIAVVGICSYAGLVFFLRVAGKRTLSRMNAYDMVVTMALGSILAKVLLAPDNSISESLAAMLVLIGLQYATSVLMCRFTWLRELVAAQPTVLFHKGIYIDKALKKERVSKEEIMAAMQAKGVSDPALVEAVILGANGDLNVLLKPVWPLSQQVATASKRSGAL